MNFVNLVKTIFLIFDLVTVTIELKKVYYLLEESKDKKRTGINSAIQISPDFLIT